MVLPGGALALPGGALAWAWAASAWGGGSPSGGRGVGRPCSCSAPSARGPLALPAPPPPGPGPCARPVVLCSRRAFLSCRFSFLSSLRLFLPPGRTRPSARGPSRPPGVCPSEVACTNSSTATFSRFRAPRRAPPGPRRIPRPPPRFPSATRRRHPPRPDAPAPVDAAMFRDARMLTSGRGGTSGRSAARCAGRGGRRPLLAGGRQRRGPHRGRCACSQAAS